jgi:xanthine dehydrogenase small subunit
MTSLAPARSTHFAVNGAAVEVNVAGGTRLLDVLRVELGLTGTKEGCGEGECGACTVLVDGQPVNSCLVPVGQLEGRRITTIEGLSGDSRLDPVQAAFVDAGGVQCGMCTPGIVMSARAFLESGADPTDAAVREAIAGNLCRCTGYMRIVDAITAAASMEPREIEGGEIAGSERPGGQPAVPRELQAAAIRAGVEAGSNGRVGPALARPRTLVEASELLAEGSWRPIAGGTDVMVALAGLTDTTERPLLDLTGIEELHGIRVERERLVIGAATTFAELRRSGLVAGHLPVLAETAATIGGLQIQDRATLGGNIANASPAGDSLPVLLATDAEIVLGGTRGERAVPASEFFTGYRATALGSGELILRVEIPLPAGRRVRFRKVGTRRALAISKVVMAVSWREVEGGVAAPGAAGPARWRDVRVAVGSVAPVPMRARAAEVVLEGASPTARTADAAAAAIAAEVVPIDDVRSTEAYRRAVTARVLRRIVQDAGGW